MNRKRKWKLWAILVALSMVMSLIPQIGKGGTVEAAGASTVLKINWSNISSVGNQLQGSYACGCFATAYCRTILDGYAHSWAEYDYYGGGSQYSCAASWSSGGYSCINTYSGQEAWRAVYDSINKGRPAIVYVESSGVSEHWVAVVGYENVTDPNNLSASNFLYIDSIYSYSLDRTYNVGGQGYHLKVNSKGGYYYCVTDSGSAFNGYNPEGSFDIARSTEPGKIWVYGWAFDRDDLSQSIYVHFYIGGNSGNPNAEVHVVKADVESDDLATSLGVSGKHRFIATLDTKLTGTQEIHAYAINILDGNENPEFGSHTVSIMDGYDPKGTYEKIISEESGTLTIKGFCYDPDAPTESTRAYVTIGGPAGTAGIEDHAVVANIQRDDLNARYGVTGKHGFDSKISVNKTGLQDVYLYALNHDKDSGTLIGQTKVCFDVKGAPAGESEFLDSEYTGTVSVRGWAYDPDVKSDPITIYVCIGGLATTPECEDHGVRTNVVRTDINSKYNISGTHGYDGIVKTKKTGFQDVWVFALNQKDGENVLLAHSIVNILPHTSHQWDDGVVIKEPTCTETGTMKYSCRGCDETYETTIAKKDHTIVVDPAVEATVTSTGLTEGKHCSVCGKVIVEQQVIPKKSGVEIKQLVVNGKTITVNWTANTGARKFALYRREGSNSWVLISSSLTGTSYKDEGLKADTTYSYRIKGYFTESGWSSVSATVSTATAAPIIPAAPKTVAVTGGIGKITVAWSKVTGADYYALYRREYVESKWGSWTAVNTKMTASKYIDTSVVEGKKYQYRARACSEGVWGNFTISSAVQAEAQEVTTVPAAPETIKAVAYTTKISISWSPVEGATKYALYRREYSNSKWSSWVKIDTALTKTSYADTTAKSKMKYQYRVKACNAAGWGTFAVSGAVVAK